MIIIKEIDISQMMSLDELKNSDIEDVDLLLQLADEAMLYVKSHSWCKEILEIYFDRGWGDMVAVFYITIKPNGDNVDNSIWVIVGDLPPAYFDPINCKNGAQALEGYVDCMQEWVRRVYNGENVDDVISVNVPTEKKYAQMLEARLQIIKDEILSEYKDEL